jgi:signal transduction histidine kinase
MPVTSRSPLAEKPTWVLLLVLFNGLAVVTLLASLSDDPSVGSVVALIAYVVVVDVGLTNRSRLLQRSRSWTLGWLLAISLMLVVLVAVVPVGVYLVFPLYVLLVWSVGIRLALGWSALLAGSSIVAIGVEQQWSIGGIVGPVVGYLVAVGGAWAYRRLHDEATARDRMFHELQATQEQLSVAQLAAGQMAERARLAQELHDTTSQSFTSIQMLLRTVEAADPQHREIDKIELARRTAADGLAETRRFIHDLTPTGLVSDTLAGALARLATDAGDRTGIRVTATSHEDSAAVALPLPIQVVLLRVAQGAIANVERHSRATNASIDLTTSAHDVYLRISDDGTGYAAGDQIGDDHTVVGFGINTMYTRMRSIDGQLSIDSAPGDGTHVMATVPLSA